MRSQRRLRPVPALTVLLGLAALVIAGTGLARDRPPPGGFGATAALTPTIDLPMPASSHPPTRYGSAPAAPTRLAIPALGVQAPVVPISATAGVLEVPNDPAQVGWWSASALAGAASGSIVIDGHVDSAATGPGALFHLTDLTVGARVIIATATGDQRRYVVIGRRVYPKTGGLPADVFAADGPPRLVLITCGGPFDHAAGSYLDNIVVFATPERDAAAA